MARGTSLPGFFLRLNRPAVLAPLLPSAGEGARTPSIFATIPASYRQASNLHGGCARQPVEPRGVAWGGEGQAAGDSFMLVDLDRAEIEAMVRGDWLARKVVDIVPYWLGSSKGSADRVDQIVSMLHDSIGGAASHGHKARA